MVQEVEVTEVDIDGRTFGVRPVGFWVLESGNVVAEALAVSLDKPLEWAVGFFFGNTELSLELWKPGEPGNPAGRPKGTREMTRFVLEVTRHGEELVETLLFITRGQAPDIPGVKKDQEVQVADGE